MRKLILKNKTRLQKKFFCFMFLVFLASSLTKNLQAENQKTTKPNSLSIDILAFLEVDRYKPLPVINDFDQTKKFKEKSSQTDQLQTAGFRFKMCQTILCDENMQDDLDSVNAIYNMDFALLYQLGSYRSKRNNRDEEENKTQAIEFLPGNQLYAGINYFINNEIYSELTLGRDELRDKIHDEITGAHGPLSGLQLKFASHYYGNLQIWMHRPELAGSYLNDDGKNDAYFYRNDFSALAKSPRSIAQKIAYQIQFETLALAIHHETQQFTETTLQVADPYKIDSIGYSGIGFSLQNPNASTWNLKFYLAIERSDAQFLTLLRNEEKIKKSNVKAHALRSGIHILFKKRFLFHTEVFLAESKKIPKGSQAEVSENSGFIGYGNNPAKTRLLASSLDMKPWYEHCPNRDKCDSIQYLHSEPGMRQPSGVLNIKLAYTGEQNEIALTGSIMHAIAASENSGSNPFSRLKKDTTSFQYREIEFSFIHKLQNNGKLRFKYNRLYRIRPDEPQDNLSQSPQKRRSALAAEGVSLHFEIRL